MLSSKKQHRKSKGIHYTPSNLASFLSDQIISVLPKNQVLKILDPAIGDGQLIKNLLAKLRPSLVESVTGIDTEASAIEETKNNLKTLTHNYNIEFLNIDFLNYVLDNYGISEGKNYQCGDNKIYYDVVIANPPYVRTQVLGAKRAKELGRLFNLSGRVDLYYTFLKAIHRVMKENGILCIIVSNRFMSTASGRDIRLFLSNQFKIMHIWDFGDTKLFEAAILPAVLLLRKEREANIYPKFTQIYKSDLAKAEAVKSNSIFSVLDNPGHFLINNNKYLISKGILKLKNKSDTWSLSNKDREMWLRAVSENTFLKFSDLGKIRVGIKTNADKIFIRKDWPAASGKRPELLQPILTHHDAERYRTAQKPTRSVLYPHLYQSGKRVVADLTRYPNAYAYLIKYKNTLSKREYLVKANRKWFEIWVPQNPALWVRPKLVFRDISEKPTFWLDFSGSIVNGDCYWLSFENESNIDLFWLALGVANSDFISIYYDYTVNNKLYAGRRRFMTQYVNDFPLPNPIKKKSKRIIELTKTIYNLLPGGQSKIKKIEKKINALIKESFGIR